MLNRGNNVSTTVDFVSEVASFRCAGKDAAVASRHISEAPMTLPQAPVALVARILLSFIFLTAGFAKLGDVSGTMAYTASGGLPGVFGIGAIALEILGGLAILVGWQTRWAALALAVFSVVAGFLYHYVPAQALEGFARMAEMNQFYKNVTIAGGLLLLTAFGPGALSLDARQTRRVAAA
jgi:putative oxidoreductase